MKLRSTKLLRAVTFSSLAALTSLSACGDDEDQPGGTAGSAGSTAGKAGASSGGKSSAAGSSNGGAATGGKGGTTSVAGNTTAGSGGSSAGSGGSSAGSGGSPVAGAGGEAGGGAGGEAGGGGAAGGGGGDTSSAGAGGSGETAGAGGMGGAPEVPTPINLSIGKVATASTQQLPANPAANAIDGNVATRWCANSGADGNWIYVDLGASHTLTGAEIVWEKGAGTNFPNAKYKYNIEVSTDNATWTMAVDQSANVSTAQTHTHAFSGNARYVRVTVLDIVDANLWACTLEVRVMGY